jgi:hypothetical protein
LLKGDRGGQHDRCFGVRYHKLGKGPVVLKTCHFASVAVSRLIVVVFSLGEAAAAAPGASILEI